MKQPPVLWKLAQVLCRVVTSVMFDLKVYGAGNVPQAGGVLLVTNHESHLDPVLIGVQLRRPISYLAKSELFANPFFGWLIRNLYAFPVRQGAGDVGAMKETISRLKEGHLLNIFPEGSRSPDGNFLPVEAGVALVVRRAGVPVVPCVVEGAYEAMPRGKKLPIAKPIRVMYGEPIDMAGWKTEEVVRTIEQKWREMMADLKGRA
jgi:1-acyl-sn-glycerol-3-phosphate acyltransferase